LRLLSDSYTRIRGAFRLSPGGGSDVTFQIGPLPSISLGPNICHNFTGAYDEDGKAIYYVGYASSSRKTKKNIVYIHNNDNLYNVNNFMKLKPAYYNPKENEYITNINLPRCLGFIAEDIAELKLNELVDFENNDITSDPRSLYYDRFTVFLVKIVQEQQTKIETMDDTINTLNGKIEILNNTTDSLTKTINSLNSKVESLTSAIETLLTEIAFLKTKINT
jgi:hypothetical protein